MGKKKIVNNFFDKLFIYKIIIVACMRYISVIIH